ncbi:MAG: TIR domain-containing protein [Verrucomicrobiota bacterium]
MSKFRIFFSNRNTDRNRVDRLLAELESLLPNMPFEDVSKEVPISDQWQVVATTIFASCDAVVCLVGQDTHESEAIAWEIREAHRLNKPLVIVKMSPEHALPPVCAQLHLPALDWNSTLLAGLIAELLLERALFARETGKSASDNLNMIWNQYGLMVKSWEALIQRRQNVNTLYISAVAALLAVTGVTISSMDKTGLLNALVLIIVLGLIGTGLSLNWRRTLISYGTLSRAKSKVVSALEKHLPAQLFDAEWKILEAKKYRSTTDTDKQTALFYILLFLTIACVSASVFLTRILRSPPIGTAAQQTEANAQRPSTEGGPFRHTNGNGTN